MAGHNVSGLGYGLAKMVLVTSPRTIHYLAEHRFS